MSNIAITPQQFTSFGGLLKFLRHRAGLSQVELSIAVGYSESQISRLEQNERAPEPSAVAARFVPALELEKEPAWVTRLLELAEVSHTGAKAASSATSPQSARNNLPLQLTSFIGREREIKAIKHLLSDARLVTLVGVGGVGKTRLALRVAGELVNEFADGVWWVDLAPLDDPTLVPQRLAAVLGLREEPNRAITDSLVHHLRARNVLVVLDNCERLISACAQLADAVLSACPEVRMLATSREALDISGEQVFVVPTLSLPDASRVSDDNDLARQLNHSEAARLFLERAADASSHFKLTSRNAKTIAQICQRLDGIPLAIELAAARLRMLPVEQIAARLDDRFRLFIGGSRTAPPRHQTLQALIDWSYDLLSEPERVLFRRLAVFAGGWTLEAAEAVCVGDSIDSGRVLELTSNLIDKSLVLFEEQGDAARYRMLETIRQYALQKFQTSGEENAIRRAHAEYYVTLMQDVQESERRQRMWPKRIAQERDNLLATLKWSQTAQDGAELGLRLASALADYNLALMWGEKSARLVLEGALAHAAAAGIDNPAARARILYRLAIVHAFIGDYAAAQTLFAETLRLFQDLDDRVMIPQMLYELGWLARERGDTVTARTYLEQCLAIRRAEGNKASVAGTLTTLGLVAVMEEDTVRATTLLEEGLALSREINAIEATGWALNHLGQVAQLKGEYARALQLHQESLTVFRKFDPDNVYIGSVYAYQGLGETALAQGDAQLAAKYLKEVFRFLGSRERQPESAWCLAGFAGIAALNEGPERAAWLWGAAEQLRQSVGARDSPPSRALCERLMKQVRAQLGEENFQKAWAQGQAATMEEAIAQALQSEK